MIFPEVYEKQMKDRACGKDPTFKAKRDKFYEIFKKDIEQSLKRGRVDKIMLGWEDELPCRNWDEYAHCLYPAALDVVQELRDLGYYVDLRQEGWLHVVYVTIRTKPNLWEKIAKCLNRKG